MSTPWVLYAMETAAYEAIRPHLGPMEASVGVGFEFEHLAATPPGDTLIATATITAVEGNKVMLDFEARDSHELVAKGKHVRAVIDQGRFQKRLERKRRAT